MTSAMSRKLPLGRGKVAASDAKRHVSQAVETVNAVDQLKNSHRAVNHRRVEVSLNPW